MYDVAIINYEMGNLRSIQSACKYVGLNSIITNKEKIINNSKCILLPGVGAFSQAMKNIKKLNLENIIKNFNKSGKLIFGVCLGMQLLFDESNEIKKTKGLGLIKGKVENLNKKKSDKNNLINIGWEKISVKKKKGTCLNYSLNNKSFYFIHKYCCKPKNKDIIIANSRFNNVIFCSAIKSKNIEAYQFHPEKSGISGLKIYKNIKEKIRYENFI